MANSRAMDIEVMKIMRETGEFDHINAHFLSDVAGAIQGSDLESLKPYRKLRDSVDDQIAAEIVLNYLKKHNMQFTLKCIAAETNGELAATPKKAQEELDLDDDNQLRDLLSRWIDEENADIVDQNKEYLYAEIESRLKELKTVKPPKRSPAKKSK